MTDGIFNEYAVKNGYDKAEYLTERNGEKIYTGAFTDGPMSVGFPLLMTIRDNRLYEFTEEEAIGILAELPDR